MRTVLVDKFPPLPADDGGKIRSAEILRRLAELGEVVLCTFEREGTGRGEYAELGVDLRTVPLDRTTGATLRGIARTGSGSSGRFWHRRLAARVADALREAPTDVLQVEHGQLSPYLALARGQLRVLDLHNIDSELAASYAHSAHTARASLARFEARLLRRLERRAMRAADLVITVSEADAEALPTPHPEVLVCPNGWRAGSPLPPADRPDVVFTALFSWRPNVEAAVWFARRVWPGVVRACPAAELWLVGRDPAPPVRALAGSSVHVTGAVPDTAPFLARARVAVAPLLAGGGTRLKVLEALDAGRPVVATSAGIAGLNDLVGSGVIVADQPDEMARSIAELLSDETRATGLGLTGNGAVRRRYAWDTTLAPLVERLKT